MKNHSQIERRIKSLITSSEKTTEKLRDLLVEIEISRPSKPTKKPKRTDKSARDAKIFQAFAEGAVLSEIGKAVGLSATRVQSIAMRRMRVLHNKSLIESLRPSVPLTPKKGDVVVVLAENTIGRFSILRRTVRGVYDDKTFLVDAGGFHWKKVGSLSGQAILTPKDVLAINPPRIPAWLGENQ